MSDFADPTATEVATSPDLPSEPAAEQDYDALIAQAAEALASDEPTDDEQPQGAAQEPADEPEAKADDAEPAEQDEPAEGQETAAEDEAEPTEPTQPWQFAQLRRQQKALAKERDELRALAEDLRPLKEAQAAMPDPRRDPLGFNAWAAERAGMTPAQLYELQTQRQLKDGEPDPLAEVNAIREELAQLKAERDKERAAADERAKAEEAQRLLAEDIDGVAKAAQAAGKYAAAWPRARFQREAEAAVQWAYSNAPEMTYEGIAKALDGMARKEYEAMLKTLGGGAAIASEDRDTSKARDGQGTPGAAAPKPAGTQPRSTLTNNDAAQGGAAHRELTDEERYAKAAEALAEAL